MAFSNAKKTFSPIPSIGFTAMGLTHTTSETSTLSYAKKKTGTKTTLK